MVPEPAWNSLQFPLCFTIFICFQEQKKVYEIEGTRINPEACKGGYVEAFRLPAFHK